MGATVRTSEANLADACSFAWLQLIRYQPQHETGSAVFPWLCKAAIREAIKLDRQSRRGASLEQLTELADALSRHDRLPARADRSAPLVLEDRKQRLDRHVELLATAQAIAAAGLRPRERRAVCLRGMGYGRGEVAALTGDSLRSVDRQLMRARRKLRDARHA